ncbi:MAG: hypothetical protein IKO32_00805 [Lachnospiraceae bacterium]|nr:hypothetical protein [Lachnospiraceae bacterium]
MEYNQEAEIYWNRLLGKFGCTPETICNIQFDFSGDSDYLYALQLSTPEQRAEYEEICGICAYNMNLQYNLNGVVHDYIENHKCGLSDTDLFDSKKRLEDDMKKVKKKISKAWWTPLPFVGTVFWVIDFIIMSLIFIFYDTSHRSDMSDFVAGCFFFSTIFIVLAYALTFSYLLLFDILYNIFLIIYAFIWFVIGVTASSFDFSKPGFFLIYGIPMLIIPLIVFLSTFPWKFARRLKRDKMLEQYANDMEWYEDTSSRILDSFENYMNNLYADYSSRKTSPDAFLVLPQEAYDYRDSLQQDFAKKQQFYDAKKPK